MMRILFEVGSNMDAMRDEANQLDREAAEIMRDMRYAVRNAREEARLCRHQAAVVRWRMRHLNQE